MRSLFFAVLFLALSCDGSSGGAGNLAACGPFAACGGSLVETWEITGYCSDVTSATTGSCTLTMETSNFHLSGTFTFSNDGSYTSAGTVSGTLGLNYAPGCFAGTTMSCARISSTTSSSDAGVSLTCTSGSAGDCQCTENIANVPSAEQGTYTTSGTSVTMIKAGSTQTPTQADYCVQGDTLRLRQTSSTAAAVNGSSILVLAKR